MTDSQGGTPAAPAPLDPPILDALLAAQEWAAGFPLGSGQDRLAANDVYVKTTAAIQLARGSAHRGAPEPSKKAIEAALRPFAVLADEYDQEDFEDDHDLGFDPMEPPAFTVGDLRRAKRVYDALDAVGGIAPATARKVLVGHPYDPRNPTWGLLDDMADHVWEMFKSRIRPGAVPAPDEDIPLWRDEMRKLVAMVFPQEEVQ